jgi:hypothetical protein
LPHPTLELARNAISQYDSSPGTALPDGALRRLFSQHPTNTEYEQVLPKVATLNAVYSTNIYGVSEVAQHICRSTLDELLSMESLDAVGAIDRITFGRKTRSTYSFATKYCSFHNPRTFPIFDSYVAESLIEYNRQSRFMKFTRRNLRIYREFVAILIRFRETYKLEALSLRDLDKFLWWQGRNGASK